MASTLSVAVKSIKFSCPKCAQHIEAPVGAEGMTVDCPGCLGKVTIPQHGESKLRADCPRCLQKLRVPPESAGTEIECPVCKLKYKVPVPPPPKPPMKLPKLPRLPRWAWAGVGVALLASVGATYWAWVTTPSYSLLQVRRAVLEHDFERFQKYVDIESVATRLIDDMMIVGLIEADEDPAGQALGAGLVQLVKPRLVDEAKKQLARYVEVGNFTVTNQVVSPFQQLKTPFVYLGIRNQRRDGRIAVLGLAVTNSTEGCAHTIEIKLRDKGTYWQVAELSNISDFIQKHKIDIQSRVARDNAPIIAQIRRLLKVTALTKSTISDQVGLAKGVIFHATVKNIGSVPVRGFSAVITQRDELGKVTNQVRIRSDSRINPGESDAGEWEFKVNQFNPSEAALYNGRLEGVDIQFVRVALASGTELVVKE